MRRLTGKRSHCVTHFNGGRLLVGHSCSVAVYSPSGKIEWQHKVEGSITSTCYHSMEDSLYTLHDLHNIECQVQKFDSKGECQGAMRVECDASATIALADDELFIPCKQNIQRQDKILDNLHRAELSVFTYRRLGLNGKCCGIITPKVEKLSGFSRMTSCGSEELLLSAQSSQQVLKINVRTEDIIWISDPLPFTPTSLCVDQDGNIWISGWNTDRVIVLSSRGKQL